MTTDIIIPPLAESRVTKYERLLAELHEEYAKLVALKAQLPEKGAPNVS